MLKSSRVRSEMLSDKEDRIFTRTDTLIVEMTFTHEILESGYHILKDNLLHVVGGPCNFPPKNEPLRQEFPEEMY